MQRITVRVLLYAQLAALPLAAQQPGDKQPARAIRSDATTLILPAGSHEIKEVVDATAKFLQRNILTDERELAGNATKVQLQNQMQLDHDGCEDVVSELLYASGMVLVPRDEAKRLYEVVSLNGPRARAAMSNAPQRSPEQILARPTLKQPVATTLGLSTISAVVAINSLRPFFAQRGDGTGMIIGCTGDNSTVLLSGIQSDVANAIGILRRTDGPPPEKEEAPAAPDQQKKIAELTATVQELQRQVAALEKRIAGGK